MPDIRSARGDDLGNSSQEPQRIPGCQRGVLQRTIEQDHLAAHLLAPVARVIVAIDAEVRMQHIDHRQECGSNRDVDALSRGIVKRGSPIKANRTIALISKIYNYAIGVGVLDRGTVSPTYHFPRPGKECARERVLTDAEIKKLWNALDAQPPKVAAFFRLGLLTAQRAREILGMTKDEIDFEMATWTIPPARCKNGREHLVPLGPQAMALIEGLKNDDSPFIFPARRVAPMAMREYKAWVDEIRVATEMKKKGDFTFHDLRRTAATGMARLPEPKITRFMIDRITNHTDPGVGAVYDRYDYLNEKRAALTRWDARLAEIVSVEKV